MILYQWLDWTYISAAAGALPSSIIVNRVVQFMDRTVIVILHTDHTSLLHTLSLSLARKSVWLHGAPWSTSRRVVTQWHRCQAYPRSVLAFTVNFCNFKQAVLGVVFKSEDKMSFTVLIILSEMEEFLPYCICFLACEVQEVPALEP